MSRIPLPGESSGSQPVLPEIEISDFRGMDDRGFSQALLQPETYVRSDDMHRQIILLAPSKDGAGMAIVEETGSFVRIDPLVYKDDAARESSVTAREGLTFQAVLADKQAERFRHAGSVDLYRPAAADAAGIILASMIDDAGNGRKHTFDIRKLHEELSSTILAADEGVRSIATRRYPVSLAARIPLDNDEYTITGIVLEGLAPDNSNGQRLPRLRPRLTAPDRLRDAELPIGRISLDRLVTVGDEASKETDYTAIGITIAGPPREIPLLAGVQVIASGPLKQVRDDRHFRLQEEEIPDSYVAPVRNIRSAHGA